MLVREQDSIITAVANAHNAIRTKEYADYNAAQTATQDSYKIDVRVVALGKALDDAGVSYAEETAWTLLTSSSGIIRHKPTSLRSDISAAVASMAKPATPPFTGTTIYGELNIALTSCNKKWPAIQTAVYGLMADLGAVKDYEGIETSVRNFTIAIA